MTDIKDYIYSFFLLTEKGLKQRYLAQFPNDLSGEPKVWDGLNLHTFYEIFLNPENELYLRGNVPASEPLNIVISAKLVPKSKRVQAAECCAKWRKQNSLYCETVEEVVLSILGGKPWQVNEGYSHNGGYK